MIAPARPARWDPDTCATADQADRDAQDAAQAIRGTWTSSKAAARAAGVSAARVRRWWTEGRGSPLFDVLQIVRAAALQPNASPGRIVALVHAALHSAYLPMTDSDLTDRFHALMNAETEAQCAADLIQMSACRSWNPAAMRDAVERHAGVLQELAAVIRAMEWRGIDPYGGRH
jgi:hypothetical protein